MNRVLLFLQATDIRTIAVTLSCLFSIVIIITTPIPNDDAFAYLRAAEFFSEQGLNETLSSYGWFGYSVLIALVSQVIPFGLMFSAYLINILAFALLTHAFITLALEFRQAPVVGYAAAAVILFFPTISEMRYYLIRDFAYWAFCLTALVQLIRFNRTGHLLHAIGWLAAMTAAIFFRLEGLIILALSPFALLLPAGASNRKKTPMLFLLFGLILAGGFLTLVVFMLAGVNLVEIFNFTYRWYLPLLSNYPDTVATAAESLQQTARVSDELQGFSGKGVFVLIIGYGYTVLANLILTLGPPASAFLMYGFVTRRQSLPEECRGPWLGFLLGALLALCIFVSIMQFLTTRYAVMAALLLLSLLPLTIDNLYASARAHEKEKLFRTTCAVLLVYFAIDSLVTFGYSKRYIDEAAQWSGENIAAGETLITNSFAVAYYSGRVEAYDKIKTDPVETLQVLEGMTNISYLALALSHDDSHIREVLSEQGKFSELARFANSREDEVIIYRINNSANNSANNSF